MVAKERKEHKREMRLRSGRTNHQQGRVLLELPRDQKPSFSKNFAFFCGHSFALPYSAFSFPINQSIIACAAGGDFLSSVWR
jgi:hypothetical protein